jgi:hypothetical protein
LGLAINGTTRSLVKSGVPCKLANAICEEEVRINAVNPATKRSLFTVTTGSPLLNSMKVDFSCQKHKTLFYSWE